MAAMVAVVAAPQAMQEAGEAAVVTTVEGNDPASYSEMAVDDNILVDPEVMFENPRSVAVDGEVGRS